MRKSTEGIALAEENDKPKRAPRTPKKPAKKVSRIQDGTPEDAFGEILLLGITEIAKNSDEFTSDDVSAWVSVYCMGFALPDDKFISNVLRTAAKNGVCRSTEKTKKGFTRTMKVWQSLLHIPMMPER
jgi:hypothetical protein